MTQEKVSAKLLSLFFEGKVGVLIQRGDRHTARAILDEAYVKGVKTAYHNGVSLDNNFYYASRGSVIYVIKDNQLVVLDRYQDRYKDGVNVSFPDKDDLYIKLLGVADSYFGIVPQKAILHNTLRFRHRIDNLDEMVKGMVRKEVLL